MFDFSICSCSFPNSHNPFFTLPFRVAPTWPTLPLRLAPNFVLVMCHLPRRYIGLAAITDPGTSLLCAPPNRLLPGLKGEHQLCK
ncbi:unnamed protein product [Protopolystoma xenopodis]|uniref:Uncharacterized protein n=1 Tax=Protopolystoma xenopodis TaxID=117903 RepID=A0A3S5A0R3_9PLAT|nr:unnamed protein product [Protopolystoma xenopodis]